MPTIAQKLKSCLPFLLFATVLVTPLCGYWFACGCAWPWQGLHRHCNALVNPNQAMNCPWCVHPVLASVVILSSTLTGLAMQWGKPFRFNLLALALMVFVLTMASGGGLTIMILL